MDPAMKTADISVPLRGVWGFAKNQSSYPVRSGLMYDQEQDNCTMGLQWVSGFFETAVRISRLPMIYLFIMIMSLLQPITAAFTPQHPPGTHMLRTNAPNASTPLL